MKKSDIVVGRYYQARISGHFVTVRVDEIVLPIRLCRRGTHYRVTNLRTGRNLTFRSAQKFRLEVSESGVPV